MEKESYSIDDILSEVKKRREEQERALKAASNNEEKGAKLVAGDTHKTEKDGSVSKSENKQKNNPTPNKNKPAEKKTAQPQVKEEPKFKETVVKDGRKNAQPATDKKTENKLKEQKSSVNEQPAPKKEKDQKPVKTDKTKKAENSEKTAKAEKSDKPEKNAAPTKKESAQNSNEQGMVDILQLSSQEDEKQIEVQQQQEQPVKQKFFKTKKGKILKAFIIILVLAIIAAGVGAAIYFDKMLNNVADEDTEPYKAVEYYDGMDFLQEDFPMIDEQSAGEVYSYKEYLKYWYQNGDPVRSSHVMNILLIGEDTREEEISDTSRADSAIIVSVNIDTGNIYMTSILRDLYVYYEVNGEGYYGKINEAASNGGMNTYINTIERYYKISVDNYAVVNFASFPKIIDALGGVKIPLTDAEVYEVNNHQTRYGYVTLPQAQYDAEGNPQEVMLSGEQALAYCRIRKIDSDNARADRQKTVLSQLFAEVKNSGTLDAVKVVNQLSQYTKTGFTKKELISIGNLAIRDGWLNYNIQTTNVPSTENSLGGQYFSVSYNNWIWLADIPKDAYDLQMMIYGKSNIRLSENRPDYISMGK